MRTYTLFAVSLLMVLICSCNNPNDSDSTLTSADTTFVSPTINQDSIKKVYAQRMSTRVSAFPVRQILEAGKLNPVDEAPRDTSFFLFREDLLDAIQAKDIFFITQMLDPNIKASFGDPEGIPTFVRIWGLESPEKTKDSQLWEVLEKVLKGGGTFRDNGQVFVAPYVYATFPDDKYDSFSHGTIAGRGVRMREGPGTSTRTLKTLSYDIVKINGFSEQVDTINGAAHPWVSVETLDGTKGHVFGQFVESPIGFRAGFEKKKGGWRMVFMVAGD